MNAFHRNLASGRWAEMSIAEQLANVGSEVSRALNWRRKGNDDQMRRAVYRALELVDLCLDCGHPGYRLREVARLREALVDYFFYSNEYGSSERLWRSYFDHFAYLARRNR